LQALKNSLIAIGNVLSIITCEEDLSEICSEFIKMSMDESFGAIINSFWQNQIETNDRQSYDDIIREIFTILLEFSGSDCGKSCNLRELSECLIE